MFGAVHPPRVLLGVVIASAALFSAYWAGVDARVAFLRTTKPETALEWYPNDSGAVVKDLDQRRGANPDTPISAGDFERLTAGLERSGMDRAAVRNIATEAAMRGDRVRAEQGMRLSQALSRRDASTQSWLIERAVEKGDVAEAVTHYHRALSVFPELEPVLLPVLASALAEPDVRNALIPYVRQHKSWSTEMLRYASDKGDPANTALLMTAVAPDVRTKAFESIQARLLTRLTDQGGVAAGRVYLAKIWPDLAASITSFSVTDRTLDPRLGPFAWQLASGGTISAMQNASNGFDVSADALASGRIAIRLVPVRGGASYVLGFTAKAAGGNMLSDLQWQAYCVPSNDHAPFWQQRLSAQGSEVYRWKIDVPASCNGIALEFVTRGTDGSGAANMSVENLSLMANS